MLSASEIRLKTKTEIEINTYTNKNDDQRTLNERPDNTKGSKDGKSNTEKYSRT